MRIAILALLFLTSVSCTDAARSKFMALGDSAHVMCYSGGQKIYDGHSTGKVENSTQSDGYFFRDQADGQLKEVSGECVVIYK